MSALPAFLLHPTARRAAQIVAGLIFLASALPKIADLAGFAGSVHNFHLEPFVPMAATNVLAMTIPWVELVTGLALVVGVRPRAGAFVYTALLAVFTIGVISAMARGLSFDCGCFGKSGSSVIGATKLAENLAMMAVGVITSALPRLYENFPREMGLRMNRHHGPEPTVLLVPAQVAATTRAPSLSP